MRLPDLLEQSAREQAERDALVFPDARMRYDELDARANQVARLLHGLGIGRGSRVGVFDGNRLPAVVLFWGALKIGACTVDLPLHADAAALRRMLAECPLDALISSAPHWDRIGSIEAALPEVLLDGSPRGSNGVPTHAHTWPSVRAEQDDGAVGALIDAAASPEDTALTIYTSGTTGRPKGVMLSHHNLISNLRAAQVGMPLYPDDSILVVVPLHFIHGRMQLLAHALVGGTLVFSRGFHLPQAVVAELAQYRVRGFSGVPYHYTALLQRSSLARTDLPALRYVLVTGGGLSTTALQRLAAALPEVEIHLAYGQTEAAPRVTHIGPADLFDRPGSCGRPLPGVDVELLDDAGRAVGEDEIGEIVVSGPNVMRGYASGDALAEGTLDEQGRLHTGDLARVDPDGFIYLCGRRSEMIKQAGERIFPREIEEVLDGHPAVAESAVLGLPDPLYGEAITALVVPTDGSSPDAAELLAYCRGVLSYVRAPRRVQHVERLPKTSSGKIDRTALSALVDPPPAET